MAEPKIGQKVICPLAPKYTRHGYNGRGYIGRIDKIDGDLVTVRFGGNGTKRFHKSNVSYLREETTTNTKMEG